MAGKVGAKFYCPCTINRYLFSFHRYHTIKKTYQVLSDDFDDILYFKPAMLSFLFTGQLRAVTIFIHAVQTGKSQCLLNYIKQFTLTNNNNTTTNVLRPLYRSTCVGRQSCYNTRLETKSGPQHRYIFLTKCHRRPTSDICRPANASSSSPDANEIMVHWSLMLLSASFGTASSSSKRITNFHAVQLGQRTDSYKM